MVTHTLILVGFLGIFTPFGNILLSFPQHSPSLVVANSELTENILLAVSVGQAFAGRRRTVPSGRRGSDSHKQLIYDNIGSTRSVVMGCVCVCVCVCVRLLPIEKWGGRGWWWHQNLNLEYNLATSGRKKGHEVFF